MAQAALRTEEKLGLGVAMVLHVALVALLVLQPGKDDVPPMPDRMTVSLTSDVSLTSTAPDPVAESRAATAPTLSDEPQAAPLDQAQSEPIPAPQPVATTPARAEPAPNAATRPRDQTRRPPPPGRRPPPRRGARSSESPPARPAPRPAGGSRVGADFLPGAGDSATSSETRVPASQIGASAKASLAQAIARQLRPHWSAPQGADAEQLVTILSFSLKPDGSLSGRPRLVRQSGVTDSNAPQKDLHAERAIRAVQLAAPFNLPDEYYEAWKRVDSWRFDRNSD